MATGGNAGRGLLIGQLRMAQPISNQRELGAALGPPRAVRALMVTGAGLGAALLLVALALWFHYGTAVFFEMIAAGISACF
jgi:hypothetical protein